MATTPRTGFGACLSRCCLWLGIDLFADAGVSECPGCVLTKSCSPLFSITILLNFQPERVTSVYGSYHTFCCIHSPIIRAKMSTFHIGPGEIWIFKRSFSLNLFMVGYLCYLLPQRFRGNNFSVWFSFPLLACLPRFLWHFLSVQLLLQTDGHRVLLNNTETECCA